VKKNKTKNRKYTYDTVTGKFAVAASKTEENRKP
jgi:hypothetical protein